MLRTLIDTSRESFIQLLQFSKRPGRDAEWLENEIHNTFHLLIHFHFPQISYLSNILQYMILKIKINSYTIKNLLNTTFLNNHSNGFYS